jgi:hypothetical protein
MRCLGGKTTCLLTLKVRNCCSKTDLFYQKVTGFSTHGLLVARTAQTSVKSLMDIYQDTRKIKNFMCSSFEVVVMSAVNVFIILASFSIIYVLQIFMNSPARPLSKVNWVGWVLLA